MSVSGIVQKLKIFQRPAERFIMPLILLLWPLFASNQGINIADGMYSLGNYKFLGNAGSAGSTWFFATFLSNLWGKFLTGLPGGGTLFPQLLCGAAVPFAAGNALFGKFSPKNIPNV